MLLVKQLDKFVKHFEFNFLSDQSTPMSIKKGDDVGSSTSYREVDAGNLTLSHYLPYRSGEQWTSISRINKSDGILIERIYGYASLLVHFKSLK